MLAFTLRVKNYFKIFRLQTIRKICHSHKKYVVQHIKKFAYIKKKQYLCSVKTRTILNIILAVIAWVLLNLVIIRAILRILDIA